MPGFSFVFDTGGNLVRERSRLLHSLESLVHGEHYRQQVLLQENFSFLGFTGYEEYPLASFENERYLIYLEGKIYNKRGPGLNRELCDLAEEIFGRQPGSFKVLADWLLNADGDFVVVLLEKSSHDFAIFNDALGRLPLYCFHDDNRLILSREVSFAAGLVPGRKLDRTAIAQYLWLGYPLGERTLIRDIERLGPSTLIYSDSRQKRIHLETVHRFDFDRREHEDTGLRETAGHLCSLFLEACKGRADPANPG